MELTGKRVLLTGATGGLGRAIAEELAGRGARLVLSARKREALEELAASLPGRGHDVEPWDLSSAGEARSLAARVDAVDGLVANAALPGTGRLGAFSEEQLERALRVNFVVPIEMTHALLPGMLERGEGALVYIASLAGKAASPRASIYNSTKFGLRGFALGLREDLRGTGVGCSLVCPGFVREAGMFADSGSKPPPGLGTTTPQKVANAVARAIERNAMEIDVAPVQQRWAARVALASPALASRIQGAGGADKLADELAKGQSSKR